MNIADISTNHPPPAKETIPCAVIYIFLRLIGLGKLYESQGTISSQIIRNLLYYLKPANLDLKVVSHLIL
jgi:hypothetical protein